MVDREDIDALLIGSLYGELSSADEARLQAHLASANPQAQADRRALEDLTHARTQVRESRLLANQVEPPQSVTALLMQEAARRAPKQVSESEGWFARFVNSFVRHPAMAAAATLVLVVGVAGTLYVRKGDHFAEQTKQSTIAQSRMSASETSSAGDTAAAPAMEIQGYKQAGPVVTGAMAPGASAGSGAATPSAVAVREDSWGAVKGGEPGVVVGLEDGTDNLDRGAAEGQGRARPAGIVVTTPDSEPKDFDEVDNKTRQEKEKRTEEKADKPAPARRAEKSSAELAAVNDDRDNDSEDMSRDQRTGAAGGAAGPSNQAPQDPAAPEPDKVQKTVSKKAPASPAKPTAPTTTAPAPAPPPPPAQTTPDSNATRSNPELAWAQAQHKRVLDEVRANRCESAAAIANQIAARNPDYYTDNVQSDRGVKNCMAYVTAAREKAEAQRQKTAKKQRAEAAKPAKKPAAADKPATTSDSK